MQVHLLFSPEIGREIQDEIFKLLTFEESKAVQFVIPKYGLTEDDFQAMQEKGVEDASYPCQNLCNEYRDRFSLKETVIVILISNFLNSEDDYSCCNLGTLNGFIQYNYWYKYSDYIEKYLVNYELITSFEIASIVIRLIQSDSSNLNHIHKIHNLVAGCINDPVNREIDLYRKLRKSDLCKLCRHRTLDKAIPILLFMIRILENISDQLSFKAKLLNIAPPEKITVSNYDGYFILFAGKKNLVLTPLYKAVYYLFLKYPDGIKVKELSGHKDELLDIYRRISNRSEKDQEESSIDDLVFHTGYYFNQVRSKINKRITEQIGNPAANNYIIAGKRNSPYRINLPPEYFPNNLI